MFFYCNHCKSEKKTIKGQINVQKNFEVFYLMTSCLHIYDKNK